MLIGKTTDPLPGVGFNGNDIDVVVEAKHKELAVLNYGS